MKTLKIISAAVFLAMNGTAFALEMVVAPVTVEDRKSVLATVESIDVVDARARIGGTISELLVDEGGRVESGQLVARVIDPKLELQKDALRARISSLESERNLAMTALERARELRKAGTIPQARLDEAESAFEVVTRNLRALESERKLIDEKQEEGSVFAPADGRVIRVPVTRSAVIMAGESVATIAAGNYVLRMQLPERHARFLELGETVSIGRRGLGSTAQYIDSGDMASQGWVRHIYPEIRQGRVVADVAVPDLGDFFVGERVQVLVATGTRQTFIVPVHYLTNRFGANFVTLKDGSEVAVQPGLPLEDGIEILSGLRTGDILITPRNKP